MASRSADGRRTRAQHTREKLLAAARRLFAARGYEGASVADIAKEAGVTKGALYANFDSKEDLFLEIVRGLSEQDDAFLTSMDPAELASLLTTACPSPGSEITPDALSESLERTLLGLEGWTYAVRHEESRTEFGAGFSLTLERIASLAARQAGRTEPTEADSDTALGLVALQTVKQILGTIIGPETIDPAIARLTQQLLER